MRRPFIAIRRAFGSISETDWAILFMRFVAVVAGILIAFALEGWNSSNNDAQREERLLHRIFDESESVTAYLIERRDESSRQLLGWQRLALSLQDGTCPPLDEWPQLYRINRFPTLAPPSAVSDELVASGGLDQVSDTRIREALAGFRARLAFAQAEARGAQQSTRLFRPGDARTRLVYRPSEQESVAARYNRTALCRDPTFRDELIAAVAEQQRIADQLALLLDDSARLCALTARALDGECEPGGSPLQGVEAMAAEVSDG